MSGSRSLISRIARSRRFGTKSGPPQWMSEICAIVNELPFRPCGMPEVYSGLEDRLHRPVERRRDEAAAGIVSSQAKTMLPATPQRTAESRLVAPAPSTEPEITCVVESG